ncbi:MAG: hypothetical protein AAB092_06240 [Chloroflexota bacterium]
MFLPKTGVFAGQARVVAENIGAEVAGGVCGQFNGYGFCYVEVGGGMAAYGSATSTAKSENDAGAAD